MWPFEEVEELVPMLREEAQVLEVVLGRLAKWMKELATPLEFVLGHSDRSRLQEFLKGSIINRITRELRAVDILIVANPEESPVK